MNIKEKPYRLSTGKRNRKLKNKKGMLKALLQRYTWFMPYLFWNFLELPKVHQIKKKKKKKDKKEKKILVCSSAILLELKL